jgi:hypothetical protein
MSNICNIYTRRTYNIRLEEIVIYKLEEIKTGRRMAMGAIQFQSGK